MRVTAILIVLSTLCSSVRAQTTPSPDQGTEREQLQRSLDGACKEFGRDDQSDAADQCRRAWFSKHEEAVWRLGLNPHGSRQPQPPPS